MPSLIRFLVMIGIIVGAVYGAMYAIVVFIEPEQREMSQRVPPNILNPQRIEVPNPAPAPSDGETVDE